ncbi:MAG: hypothetical protein E6Q68_10125 [Polynucleobacter sp.]|nr:MAG: hypothetical protein E6Q68_10125 [Polynucleobacter sp.]
MVRAYRAKNMTELYDQLTDSLVHGRSEDLTIESTIDVQIHDIIAEADTMEWDFDLKDAWITKQRWSMMVRQYIDPVQLKAWIERITAKTGKSGRGVAAFRTNIVKPRGGAASGATNQESRVWGSCMLNITYKAIPQPQITLISRTSYLGYIGALDVSVAWMVGRYLAKELGIEMKDMKFVWVNQAVQWHNFKSLAYLLNHANEEKRTHYRRLMIEPSSELTVKEKREILDHPALRLSRKWLQKVIKDDQAGRTLGDMTYNTLRRIVRRFHTEVYGYEVAKQYEGWSLYKSGPMKGQQKEFFKAYEPLPSVPIQTLDLSPIGMPLAGHYGTDFVGGDDEDDD